MGSSRRTMNITRGVTRMSKCGRAMRHDFWPFLAFRVPPKSPNKSSSHHHPIFAAHHSSSVTNQSSSISHHSSPSGKPYYPIDPSDRVDTVWGDLSPLDLYSVSSCHVRSKDQQHDIQGSVSPLRVYLSRVSV